MQEKINDYAPIRILGPTSGLGAQEKLLLEEAIKGASKAYAPYSGFKVGCAILLEDGTIMHGSNQENAAYPSGLCAERVVLFAHAAQNPEKKIKKMLICAFKEDKSKLLPATSCGSCRQVMLEMEIRQDDPYQVIMMSQADEWICTSSAETLLPYSFNRRNLKKQS